MKQRSKEKGFSLVEVVLVMIILGLSISLVTPSFSRFSRTVELKAVSKKISGILRTCRSEAVQRGKVYQIQFDSALREVRILELEGESDGGKFEEKAPPRRYPIPQGIRIKEVDAPAPLYPSDLPAIEFYPSGGSSGGVIFVDNQGEKGYRIKVHFLTGSVVVEAV